MDTDVGDLRHPSRHPRPGPPTTARTPFTTAPHLPLPPAARTPIPNFYSPPCRIPSRLSFHYDISLLPFSLGVDVDFVRYTGSCGMRRGPQGAVHMAPSPLPLPQCARVQLPFHPLFGTGAQRAFHHGPSRPALPACPRSFPHLPLPSHSRPICPKLGLSVRDPCHHLAGLSREPRRLTSHYRPFPCCATLRPAISIPHLQSQADSLLDAGSPAPASPPLFVGAS